MQLRIGRALGAASAMIVGMAGCASAPAPEHVVTPQEQHAKDASAGTDIARDFERQLRLRKDVELQLFLRRIAERLSASDDLLKEAPIGVLIVDDRGKRPRNYGVPGNRVYLSAEFLRASRYENEIAAGIALELAHIRERSLLDRIDLFESARNARPGYLRPPGPPVHDYFGDAGIFAFSDRQWARATVAAVQLMYAAGYDPRGISAVCDWIQRIQTQAPLAPETVALIRERSRAEIARHSPLRNPIVRSDDFIRLQKRMERL